MLIDMSIIVSDLEMEAMLREYDANHDGVLSEEEFIMLLRCVAKWPGGIIACCPGCRLVCDMRLRVRLCPATSQAVVT
eukprot:COSAG02_NODE_3874_length_6107_cov_7.362350_7_plen_78_part_00